MTPTESGSFPFFRFKGIQVSVHWSWFVVAVIEISTRRAHYDSPVWNVAEYLALFLIVLLHEFGHVLACRQVGGQANKIVLWPLGGVAYVSPPIRPGATLWSIAAGPLVNVALLPVLFGLVWFGGSHGWRETMPDVAEFVGTISFINLSLLIFNLLPIYPLDGGQILQSLLWFPLGRARSLFVATIVGLIGLVALVGFAVMTDRISLWTGFMALFLGQQCWAGFQYARGLAALAKLPRHSGFACPSCHEPPAGGPILPCSQCGQRFDPFSTGAVCPHCQTKNPTTRCIYCGTTRPVEHWSAIDVRAESAGEK